MSRGKPPATHGAWIGPACAVAGTLGFSFKAILIKLAYAWSTIDATSLLALRMLWAAPFYLVMAWWFGRGRPPLGRADWIAIAWLGFVGYYLSSLLDFLGLVHITASLERLILFLYPTIVVLLSAVFQRKPVTRRIGAALALSYAGSALVIHHDLRLSGDAVATLTGGGLVFAAACTYALYFVGAGDVIARLGSSRLIALAMLTSTLFVLAQVALTPPLSALAVPASIQAITFAMAVFVTVVPTWLLAEAIKRMGANRASLVGSLGPVFTIALGATILGEPIRALQLAGAALVLAGVWIVTRPVPARERERPPADPEP